MKKIIVLLICLSVGNFAGLRAANDQKNKVKYEKKYTDPVLKAMEEDREKEQKLADEATQAIKKRQKTKKEALENLERSLHSDLSGVFPPQSPAAFKSCFHFPPVAQYYTNTCWSFAATSYYESEIFRLSGKKIKLAEMWTVYFEYLEKVRRFVHERGESLVAEGGESNAINRIWKSHGIVPATVFPAINAAGQKHDHARLIDEIRVYLGFVKANSLWDEQDVLNHVTVILNKHLGTPQQRFVYNGKEMTPLEFLHNETPLNMDDYVDVMSTSRYPFYTFQEFTVPDNWWHSKDYLNLPLGEWYGLVVKAIKSGYSVGIGGDVSEPGKLGSQDVCFIPSFDIPQSHINQDAREYRIDNKTTDDDHGIHLVGYARYRGHDWFLIKDSGRSARWGKHEGYYFFRGDYIKLKMLTYTVHKDILKNILPKVK
ncbi:MAG: peptidase C1 [Candidatus Aminicenantes bacterium]|nr:peptidase C1 [Candidatus Aminicenantes bacterium]